MRRIAFFTMRLVAAIALLLAVPAVLLPAGAGHVLAYSVVTNSDVDKLWAKAQGPVKKGFNFVTKEFRWVRQYKELEIEPSLREMTFPVDLYEDRGITSLPEGGREAEPMSRNAVDATVSFIHLNGRFTVSKRARWALAKDPKAALENQLKFQGRKKVEALGRVLGDMFYGFSTNYICQTSTNATQASGTYTLKNLYGSSSFAGTGSTALDTAIKKRIIDQIKIGDKVALVRSGALVTNAIGSVDAKSAANCTVDITWAGSVDSDDNDYLVFANGASATTINHTSYNRGITGRLDMLTSTSLQGISKSLVTEWDVSYSDTSSGRFSGEKWRKAADEIHNFGDEDANIVTLIAQGVYRDMVAQYKAGVRFDDAFALEVDGDVKARGKRFKSSRRVPPGMVDMFAEGVIVRKSIHEAPMSAPSWGGGKELIDDSGWIFAVEESLFIALTNRQAQAYFLNQQEI